MNKNIAIITCWKRTNDDPLKWPKLWKKEFDLNVPSERDAVSALINKIADEHIKYLGTFMYRYEERPLRRLERGNYKVQNEHESYFIEIKDYFDFIVEAFREKYPEEFGSIEPLSPYSKSYEKGKELTVVVDGKKYYYRSWYSAMDVNGKDIWKSHPKKEGNSIDGFENYNNGWEIIELQNDDISA